MSAISLTASMRSNLLSLQNIASQQDIVQNRLATGLKVSSAIDNPSSYYTASSLNNRAADLTALLDSMSQGIQTIKAASEAIDSGTKFLEQAKAIANQALETAQPVIARVSNEAELLAAIESGEQGLIVVDGDITMSVNVTLELKDGQSLVGARYLNQNASKSSLSFSLDGIGVSAISAGNNTLFSDLRINMKTTIGIVNSSYGAVSALNKTNVKLQNLDVHTIKNGEANWTIGAIVSDNSEMDIRNVRVEADTGGTVIAAYNKGMINLSGNVNIICNNGSYIYGNALYARNEGIINVTGDARLNFKSTGTVLPYLISTYTNGIINFERGSEAFIETKIDAPIFRNENRGEINIMEGVVIREKDDLGFNKSWKSTKKYNLTDNEEIKDFDTVPDKFTAIDNVAYPNPDEVPEKREATDAGKSFNSILVQYDSLIQDGCYKGINLLNSQRLKINFNEDRSSGIEILGVSALSADLGIVTAEWQNKAEIEKSVSELEEAINTLRGYASQYGNYYSIVTTRQDFTENLINVLEEGAHKLTLADMNQESANMLALQTSQQLAVNSLSLASQASQAVLRLF